MRSRADGAVRRNTGVYMQGLNDAGGKQDHKQYRGEQPVLTKKLHSSESSTCRHALPANFVLQSSLLWAYNPNQAPHCCGSLKVPPE
jgi:hypothetical protein